MGFVLARGATDKPVREQLELQPSLFEGDGLCISAIFLGADDHVQRIDL
jgi:hypothetical protein